MEVTVYFIVRVSFIKNLKAYVTCSYDSCVCIPAVEGLHCGLLLRASFKSGFTLSYCCLSLSWLTFCLTDINYSLRLSGLTNCEINHVIVC